MAEAAKPVAETTFSRRLKEAGIRKAELARTFGLDASTISRWGEAPPMYAREYVNLLIRHHNLRKVLRADLGKALLTLKNI